MTDNERFKELKRSGIMQELDELRSRVNTQDSEINWFRFQEILAGKIPGFPDRFSTVLDPIRRIFMKRLDDVLEQINSREAGDLVVQILGQTEGDERTLMEEVLPFITYTLNTSRNADSVHLRGSRRHH